MKCPVLYKQLSLFPELDPPSSKREIEIKNLDYDKFIVNYSAGKDSLNCILWLLEENVPREKIELWHQCVDGEPGSPLFMDWPATEQYVIATGKALGIKTHFQWRVGGFKGELLRENRLTNDVQYTLNGNIVTLPTKSGTVSTRRRFPAKSYDLRYRWCSANLKVDSAARVLSNHPDFKGNTDNPMKLMVISGERHEESPARAKYPMAELHRCNTRGRIVHHFRPVIRWTEDKIWALMEKYRIMPFPAYILGFSRTSCLTCIFCTPSLFAMVREIFPDRFKALVEMEKELKFTIDSKYSLEEMAAQGSLKRLPKGILSSKFIEKTLRGEFSEKDFFCDRWELPAGAYGGAQGGAV